MDITSLLFICFVIVSVSVYLVLPKKNQWIWLLVISLVFYFLSAKAYTIVYLFSSVATVYWCTNSWEGKTQEYKKRTLLITIIFNVLILAVLKYSGFAFNIIETMLNLCGINYTVPQISWIASLGVSYYTLQIVAYLLDCYWGIAKIEKNILKLTLFTCYFPQMISGPISRYKEIGKQLFEEHRFEYTRITNGMIRMVWGLFEKTVVSARLAVIVDTIYSDYVTYSGVFIWLAIVLFPLQLYTDFCGCMNIIMGVSECFGIILPQNFKAPFFSKTVQELWQRWHITLGSWLKEYIMNPILKSELFINMGEYFKVKLGKKRGKRVHVYVAMFILWLCMGIWHGSGWNYIAEGIYFWFILILEQILQLNKKKGNGINNIGIFKMLRTYILFAIGMVFFRVNNLSEMVSVLYEAGSIGNINMLFNGNSIRSFGLTKLHLIILLIGLLAVYKVDMTIYNGKDVRDNLRNKNLLLRWTCYWLMIGLIIMSLNLSTKEFLYAQF